jgi:hypothetical protein
LGLRELPFVAGGISDIRFELGELYIDDLIKLVISTWKMTNKQAKASINTHARHNFTPCPLASLRPLALVKSKHAFCFIFV